MMYRQERTCRSASNIASKLINEYWNDNQSDILGIADSFLEDTMIIT